MLNAPLTPPEEGIRNCLVRSDRSNASLDLPRQDNPAPRVHGLCGHRGVRCGECTDRDRDGPVFTGDDDNFKLQHWVVSGCAAGSDGVLGGHADQ